MPSQLRMQMAMPDQTISCFSMCEFSMAFSSHAVQQGWLPIPARCRAFGAWAAIGPKFEKRGLSGFAFLPILKLLAAQLAQPLPTEAVAVNDKNVWLRHDRPLSLLVVKESPTMPITRNPI
jgi:hypothetical protein